MVSGCKDTQEDMATLERWASIFLHPEELASTVMKNVEHHPIKVHSEVKQLETDMSDEQYIQFGRDLGDLLVELTTPESMWF